MSAVIDLAAVRQARATNYLLATAVLLPDDPLKPGDLVAFGWSDTNLLFARWDGPTGRDGDGKFVKKGSPEETYRLDDGLTYSAKSLHSGRFRIFGTVAGARVDGRGACA